VGSESLGEEAAADGGAVEEVKQAEWQIIPTKRAAVVPTKRVAMVAISSKHGEASQRAMASATSEPPSLAASREARTRRMAI